MTDDDQEEIFDGFDQGKPIFISASPHSERARRYYEQAAREAAEDSLYGFSAVKVKYDEKGNKVYKRVSPKDISPAWGGNPPWGDGPPPGPTVSVAHDGSWSFEREELERRARQAESPSLSHPLVTVWDRPRGLRGRYLDARSRLWRWHRALRGLARRSRRLDHSS